MRRFLVALACLPFLSSATLAQPRDAAAIELTTFQVDLRPREPDLKRVGRLRYLGGIVLRAEDHRFGGISGLRFVNGDEQLLGVSDRGNWIAFRPTFDGERLIGAEEAMVWPMVDSAGAPLMEPAFDAESLTFIGNTAYVGFERIHRIEAYALPFAEEGSLPRMYRDTPTFGSRENNGGLEGLTTIANGRLLAIVESANEDSTFDGWILDFDGNEEGLALFAVAPYALTDLATLPNGDVVTLERRFSPLGGVGTRLRLIPADRISAGALLDGEELAELGSGFTVDNMEGLAVRTRDSRTEIFVISDDNQNPLQRTILMAFELRE